MAQTEEQKESLKAYQREWRRRNKDKVRAYNSTPASRAARRAYKKTEKAKEQERERALVYRNLPEVKDARREYELRRYQEDPVFRLKRCLQVRLNEVLRRGGVPAGGGFSKYGVDWQAIVDHLGERPGLGWEVDHIRPLASFDLTDPEQVKEAFLPENHQWLLQHDNRVKSARWEV